MHRGAVRFQIPWVLTTQFYSDCGFSVSLNTALRPPPRHAPTKYLVSGESLPGWWASREIKEWWVENQKETINCSWRCSLERDVGVNSGMRHVCVISLFPVGGNERFPAPGFHEERFWEISLWAAAHRAHCLCFICVVVQWAEHERCCMRIPGGRRSMPKRRIASYFFQIHESTPSSPEMEGVKRLTNDLPETRA